MPVVVDASALVAILFEDPEGPAVQARLPASGLVATALELHAVPPDALVPLAQKSGLTAYNAGYLWLARELKADLVTLDSAIEKAWLKDKTDDGKTDSQI